MSWPQVQEAIEANSAVILPIGAIEAHGPHLPLETDIIISNAIASAAVEKLNRGGTRAVLAPAMPFSVTDFANEFPGTISLSKETASALLREVTQAFLRQGFKTICYANSHLDPGHIRVLREVSEGFRNNTNGVKVLFPDKRREPWLSKLTAEFRSGACHAGQYESSVVMAQNPELVQEEIRKQLKPNLNSLSEKIKAGCKTFKESGGPQAYFGDPAAASAKEGRETIEVLSNMIVTSIVEARK